MQGNLKHIKLSYQRVYTPNSRPQGAFMSCYRGDEGWVCKLQPRRETVKRGIVASLKSSNKLT
jgi:hypothetical protein